MGSCARGVSTVERLSRLAQVILTPALIANCPWHPTTTNDIEQTYRTIEHLPRKARIASHHRISARTHGLLQQPPRLSDFTVPPLSKLPGPIRAYRLNPATPMAHCGNYENRTRLAAQFQTGLTTGSDAKLPYLCSNYTTKLSECQQVLEYFCTIFAGTFTPNIKQLR